MCSGEAAHFLTRVRVGPDQVVVDDVVFVVLVVVFVVATDVLHRRGPHVLHEDGRVDEPPPTHVPVMITLL